VFFAWFQSLLENSLFSLLKKPFSSKLEEEGNLPGFSPPPPFVCNDHLFSLLSFSLLERTPSNLEFSLDFSLDLFIDLSQILNIQQQQRISLECLPLRLYGRICAGLKTGFFQVRYAPLHQPKPDTCLSSISTGAPASWRTPQRLLSTTTRRSVVRTLLRVDLTRWRVVATRCPVSADVILRSCCCVLSCSLICSVTFCYFLLSSCFVISPFSVVFRCFGVDFLFLYFLFPFGSFFSTVTSRLNLHGVFGRLFRCLNGVFGLPMVVSIIVCAAARVHLGLHSCHSFSLLVAVNSLVRALASLLLLYCISFVV
jgi:hypothetical protein